MPHIVVVGGGVAGLAAAWRLTRDSAGALSVGPGGSGRVRATLVEAAHRFGGKIVTERVGGFLIEGGRTRSLPGSRVGSAWCGSWGSRGV